ncbi:threonine aldolase family protein [Micrococcus sp.]|uniref:threonine aldolase family protein n=1 Tax=Micrococcus sp. TaxID=1271 RepID=UPI002A90D5AB|nr:beta-eliminating lyase-related protein [Micrococcus sp.]MDY6055496.1 beta-eliminating lyase-related protein [Micrococcus sp.]
MSGVRAGLRAFASDNYAGVHPDVWAAMVDADRDHAVSYGADPVTELLQERVRETFGPEAFGVPVFTGTAANVLALQAMVPPWGSVVASSVAHVRHDEGGAPERIGRFPVITVDVPDGRLTPEALAPLLHRDGAVHASQPAVVELAQSTELGTVYTPEQVRAVTDAAHAAGLSVHMDGARLSNAAAALGVPLRAFTTDAGVDVLSYGGTKNGGMGAEMVVVLRPEAVAAAALIGPSDLPGGDPTSARERAEKALAYLRKSSMQLASKHRYLAAQLLALLTDDLGVALAGRANLMARTLAEGAERMAGVQVVQPVEANAVFAALDPAAADLLRGDFPFYDWDPAAGVVRWMTSWDTTEQDVAAFLAALDRALTTARPHHGAQPDA